MEREGDNNILIMLEEPYIRLFYGSPFLPKKKIFISQNFEFISGNSGFVSGKSDFFSQNSEFTSRFLKIYKYWIVFGLDLFLFGIKILK